MELEAVTHDLRWIASRGDIQTTHAILLTDSTSLLQKMKSGMGSPDWNVPMVDIHLRKLLGMYCHGHAGVKGNHRADRLAAKATHTCFSEALKCWGAWDTACGHKAKDITPSLAGRREARKEEALDDLPWKDERGPSSIRRTLEPFQRQRWGNFSETGWSAYGPFWAHRYHLEQNWAKLNWKESLPYYSTTTATTAATTTTAVDFDTIVSGEYCCALESTTEGLHFCVQTFY